MKNFFKNFLCVTLSFVLLCVGLPIAAQAVETNEEPIRILAIGNSFSNNTTYFISRIAESRGKNVSVTSLYYAGCTLKQHVEFYNSDSRSYQFYVDGVNTTTGQLQTMKEVFELYDYDYVTLQQSPSGSDVFSTYWTEENPWLTQLYDIVKEHEPQAEIMVHQTWSFCHDCAIGNDPYWNTNYNNTKEMFNVIEDCYEQMADKIGVDKETGIIPVGVAIQLAKDEYGYGDFYNKGSGLTDAQHCANGALYTDNVDHLNWRGRYIAGCVWLEKIFGYDCRTATYFPEGVLTSEECEILRAIAHEAVTGEKAYIESDWRVLPDGDGVEIVHYMGKVPATGTLAVPTVVNGKTVTRVDDTAFKYVEGLSKLILPDANITYEDGAIDDFTIIENVWDGTSVKPTKGMGTKDVPFLIENGSHLYWAVTNKNTGVYFELQNDILLNDILVDTENGTVTVDENVHEWYLGGANANNVFEGVIDGNYHVIRGLYIDEDFGAKEQKWNIGAGLIARAGNGAKIKNLAIDNSYIKALNAAASAFVGTTGSSSTVDVGFENSFIGENVYVYGAEAGGFIGAGNGAGYVSGIADCYVLGTIKADGFVGALLGGLWGGVDSVITNCYATMKLHGQTDKTYSNCYAPEKKNTYDNVTVVSIADMKGQSAITKLAGLSEVYTLPENGYPVLKSWVGKSNEVWSGFAANTLKGNGTQSSPYLISDGEGLAFAILNCGTGKYYKLTKDIYLNDIYSVNWETAEAKGNYVPSSWLEEVTFNGYFDGGGYAVYGIYYPVGNGKENSTFTSAALFPLVNSNTHIKNVGVRYSHIEIFGHASGIVGFIKRNDTNKNIVIDSCFADETNYIVHTRQNDSTECSSAGILGGTLFTPNIAISNCYSLANLSGPYNNAHIIGSTWQAPETVTVTNCYAVGKPWMNSSAAISPKTVENCYSTIAPNETYAVWTQVSLEDMQGENALVNMPLGDKFVATEGYPMLKVFVDAPEVPVVLPGDVNGDGIIDTTDLAGLKIYLAGDGEVSDSADMNADATVDTTDLASLKIYLSEN